MGISLLSLVVFRDKIPLDMMGKDPLDMNQYKRVFGTCRIPGVEKDGLVFHSGSKHIVVVHNNNVSALLKKKSLFGINKIFNLTFEHVLPGQFKNFMSVTYTLPIS